MNPTTVLVALWSIAALSAQESHRTLERTGQHDKFLTSGQRDTWSFVGGAGETVSLFVQSGQFDPVLSLLDPDQQSLLEVDDPGTASRCKVRLPRDGRYQIQVASFRDRAGGNYTLQVERWRSAALEWGQDAPFTAAQEGRAWFHFQARRGQAVWWVHAGAVSGCELLDPKGIEVPAWANSAVCTLDGEYTARLTAPATTRGRFCVQLASLRDLAAGSDFEGQLAPHEVVVLRIAGEPGQFVVADVQLDGPAESRLLRPRWPTTADTTLDSDPRPDFVSVPALSRGRRQRLACVLGHQAEYWMQLASRSSAPVAYRLRCGDPTQPLVVGVEVAGRLAVGGAVFHGLAVGVGRLLQLELRATGFAGELRLLDDQGRELAFADDGGPGELDSCATHLVRQAGHLRVQVAARGGGGGGDYRLIVRELTVPELRPAQWHEGRLGSGGVAYWSLEGRKDQRIVLLLRSATVVPTLELQGPDGERLALGCRAGADDDLLLSARLPRDGRCVVWVRAQSGDGAYRLRLVDGE